MNKQYVKFISETGIQYPKASDFPGVVNPLQHDTLMRSNGFYPLTGKPAEQEGKTLHPDTFAFHYATKQVTESYQVVVEDYDEDPETHERRKTGEHFEWRERIVEKDDSTISVESYHYEDIPEPEPPDTTKRDNTEKNIVAAIRSLATKYNAVADIEALPDLTIPALMELAQQKGVPEAELGALITTITPMKWELEAIEDKLWAECWEGLKSRFPVIWQDVNGIEN